MAAYASIQDMPQAHYGLIMADPPWSFKLRSDKGARKSAQAHYACRDLDWIKSLPVADIAAPDCLLWLWATNPMVPQALEVLHAWGFAYKTQGAWVKRTVNGHIAFGTGYILRCAHEPWIIATRGRPRTTRSTRSAFEGPVREHSRKPDEAFEVAERLVPRVPRCELFSREPRLGWDIMGDEVTKFSGELT